MIALTLYRWIFLESETGGYIIEFVSCFYKLNKSEIMNNTELKIKNIVKNMTTSIICFSLLGILLGIGLIIRPDVSIQTMGILFAIILLFNGVTLIYLDIKAIEYYVPFEGLLPGALNIILAIILFRNPADFGLWLSFTLGTYVIISSINDIRLAFNLRHLNIPWVLLILINIVNILAGVFMFYSPALSSVSIVTSIGIVMIVNSIIRLIDMFSFRSQIKDVEKYVRLRVREVEDELNSLAEANKIENKPAEENAQAEENTQPEENKEA